MDSEKRFVRRAVSISCVAAALLAVALLLVRAYWPELTLLRVSGLLTAGRTDEALALLDDVDVERAGQDAVDAQRYRAALALEEQGRREEALALFDQLAGYANAGERALQTRYEQAEETLAAGDLEGAMEAFFLLGDYRDAAARYQECVLTLHPTVAPTDTPTVAPMITATAMPTSVSTVAPAPTVIQAPTATVIATAMVMPTSTPVPTPTVAPAPSSISTAESDTVPATAPVAVPTAFHTPEATAAVEGTVPVTTGFPATVQTNTPSPTLTISPTPTATPAATPVPTTEAEGIAAGQANTPCGILALGYHHTVGLLENGMVTAVGSNDAGQCNVGEWTEVVQVAAGAAHTLALREDGTALATGDDQYGQCDVSQWRDLIQVSAGAYDSFGLRRDGTVVHCGWHEYDGLDEWHDLKRIAAGSYGLIALHSGGCLSTHPSMRLNGVFADADAARGYAVGLCADGTLAGANVTLPEWRSIVSVSAGDGGILALDAQGNVHAKFFRSPAPQPPTIDGRVIAVEAGATHYALLLSDGRVLCFGEDDLGQCQTGNWRLRTAN